MRFASYPSRLARGSGAKRPKFDRKMTFREILSREEANHDSIWLYREGMFVKAYDRSAFFTYTLIHEFKVSRRYVKSVNADVYSLGFPEQTVPKWLNGFVYEYVQDGLIRCHTRQHFDEPAYLNWKELVGLNVADRFTPHTSLIEKTPVYKTAYDLLVQVLSFSKNISRNLNEPIGKRLKEFCYGLCYSVRILYDVEDRAALLDKAMNQASEIKFLLQILKDMKEISVNTYALSSERIVSVSKQLQALRGKVKAEVHEV